MIAPMFIGAEMVCEARQYVESARGRGLKESLVVVGYGERDEVFTFQDFPLERV
jgi:hypothetical protein